MTLHGQSLECSCGFYKSVLCPCRHIFAVKEGHVVAADFHLRWHLAWYTGLIPLTTFARSHNDGARGPTYIGVNLSAPIDESDSKQLTSPYYGGIIVCHF